MPQDTSIPRLPNIPEKLRDHPLFQLRRAGACLTLRGKVRLTLIFTSVPGYPWSRSDAKAALSQIQKAAEQLRKEARSYHVPLDLTLDCRFAKVNASASMQKSEEWAEKAAAKAGLTPFSTICTDLPQKHRVDSAPLVFCLKGPGRSFAHCGGGNSRTEYAILFHDTAALRHELGHIFGASDLYYPSALTSLVQEFYPTSIMLHSAVEKNIFDSFSAYLLGWTDKLSAYDQKFLKKVAAIPRSAFSSGEEVEHKSGHVHNFRTRVGLYTGEMLDGLANGKGYYRYDDGAIYEGGFVFGVFHGKGKYTTAQKTCYTGTYVKGELQGPGTIRWKDGSKFKGSFLNDLRHGHGTYTGSDGSCYSGDYCKGEKHGKGTYRWSTRDFYTGEFQHDHRHGKGIYQWSDGSRYEGEFREDKRTGKGKLVHADGSWYSGEFLDGLYHGKGIQKTAYGICYEGQFVNGSRCGLGTILWPDKSRYHGMFKNGVRWGKGTMVWADGSYYTGEFVNDQRNGCGKYVFTCGTVKNGRWINGDFMG